MTGKHTRGPWKVNIHNIPGYAAQVLDEDGDLLCDLDFRKGGKDEEDANAHLIAAAPDLLEVLEEILLLPDAGDSMKKAKAVINKARGK